MGRQSHEVECDSCNRTYQVELIYEFIGLKVQKIGGHCNEVEEDCYCEIDRKGE